MTIQVDWQAGTGNRVAQCAARHGSPQPARMSQVGQERGPALTLARDDEWLPGSARYDTTYPCWGTRTALVCVFSDRGPSAGGRPRPPVGRWPRDFGARLTSTKINEWRIVTALSNAAYSSYALRVALTPCMSPTVNILPGARSAAKGPNACGRGLGWTGAEATYS
jgi:hypothetical protein